MSTLKPVHPYPVWGYTTHIYPKQVWYSLAGFVGLLTLAYLVQRLILWRAKRSAPIMANDSREFGRQPIKSPSNASVSFRRIPVGVVNALRVVLYRFTLPVGGRTSTVAEIAIISAYIIMLTTWQFVNSLNAPTGIKLDAHYWANHAGDMAAIQFPLLALLAGKNNLISLVTGISYEKINILHRAAARTCFVLMLVHAVGRVILTNSYRLRGFTSISHMWVKVGIAAAIAYGAVVLLAIRPFRTRYHEIFLSAHFFLILYVHGDWRILSHRAWYSEYIIPTFVLWGLDRTLRLARILWNNRNISRPSTDEKLPLTATAELLSSSMVRLTMKRHMYWKAGQCVFLTMPAVSDMPYEAHPFTICNIPGNTGLMDDMEKTGLEGNENGGLEPSGRGPSDLVFLIRVKNGFTRRLLENVEQKRGADGKAYFSVLIDGPYGIPPDVNAYESVILVAGGSGITFSLPLLQDIVLKTKEGRSACRNILFIWIVPHEEQLSWISGAIHEALQNAPPSLHIRIHLHVTQPSPVIELRAETTMDGGYESKQQYMESSGAGWLSEARIRTFRNGRPDIRSMLEEEILVPTVRAVSVNVAGPPSIAEDVRKALRFGAAGPLAILRGRPSVNLHVETFEIAVRMKSCEFAGIALISIYSDIIL
ncbi:ferric reductase NAD binding domain-containing protein [Hysterangium stoloniferum]|nr:ferric reductase NAD binding domain-containing protein [Hysterangium stoloniferum]